MKSKESRLPRPPTNVFTVVFAIIAVFFLLTFGRKTLEGYRVHRHNAMLRAEVADLEEQQKQLAERLEYVQTSEYVERVAREQYKWTQDGETLVIPVFKWHPAIEVSPTSSPQPVAGAYDTPSTCYWQDWWTLLAGPFD